MEERRGRDDVQGRIFPMRGKLICKIMGSRAEERERENHGVPETIIVVAACVVAAIICAYVIYAAM
jgi:hypothetical protein